MERWETLASDDAVRKTTDSLRKNGIEVFIVGNGGEARKKVFELIPEEAEVMNNASMTLEEIGVSKEILESGKYNAVRKRITDMKDAKQRHEFRRMFAVAEYDIGSAQAVTEQGQIVIVSNTGSQLAPIAAGSSNVILVIGTQKIVKDMGEAMERIEKYALPIESERLKKMYGVPSNISKTLIISREVVPGRMKVIFVRQKLGF